MSPYPLKLIGDVLTLEYGKPLPESDRSPDGDVPAYGANGVLCRTKSAFRTRPSIIVGRKGSAGEVNVTDGPFWPTDVTYFVEHDDCITDLRYLFHLLKFLDLPKLARGVKPGINRNDVYALHAPIPPLDEQKLIAAMLDKAFEGIAKATANAEKNLANARDLFLATLRSELSASDDIWAYTTIGDQITLQRGMDITKSEQRSGAVPVVSSGGIKSYHDTAIAKGPGVVIGRKGSLGTTYFIQDDYWPHDTTLWVKDFKGNLPKFVYYFLTSLDLKSLDSGAANPALNRNNVHPIIVTWPPIDVQAGIVVRLEEVYSRSDVLSALYRRKKFQLDELKQSLLHKAFAGKLTAAKDLAA